MSVCTLPPGGVSPGASRWSAAPADDGAALWARSTARTIAPATASKTASPSVLLFTTLADVMCCSLLSSAPDPGRGRMRSWFARGTNSVRRELDRTARAPRANSEAMRSRTALVGLAAASLAATALLLGGVLSGTPAGHPPASASPAPTAADQASLGRLLEGFSTGNTAGYVRKLERRVAAQPQDADALTLLSLAYQQ